MHWCWYCPTDCWGIKPKSHGEEWDYMFWFYERNKYSGRQWLWSIEYQGTMLANSWIWKHVAIILVDIFHWSTVDTAIYGEHYRRGLHVMLQLTMYDECRPSGYIDIIESPQYRWATAQLSKSSCRECLSLIINVVALETMSGEIKDTKVAVEQHGLVCTKSMPDFIWR